MIKTKEVVDPNNVTDLVILPLNVGMDKRLTTRHLRVLIAYFYLSAVKKLKFENITRGMISEITGFPLTRISTIKRNLEKLGWIDRENKTLNLKGN